MANTGKIGAEIKSGGLYEVSFGAIPDGTRYYDPKADDFSIGTKGFELKGTRGLIKNAFETGYKALTSTTGGAGTAGYAMVPVFVDPRIVDLSRKYTPLVELIPRVTNKGLTADYNVITAKGGAFTAAEDAALTETNDTYDRRSKSIKFLYAVGRVTGPARAAMPSYVLEGFSPAGAGNEAGSVFSQVGVPNAKQLEVVMKARALKEFEEYLIVNGDSSSDSTEFDGIVKQQGTTNQIDLSSAALTWDDIERAIRTAFDNGGRPKLAIASSAVVEDIRKILIDTFRYSPDHLVGTEGLPVGIPPQLIIHTMVGPIPVIPSMYLSNSSGSKQIYFLDTDFIEMRVLQDMTYEELAKTSDAQKFMLKIYECLVMKAPQFNAFIDNIA